MYMHYSDRYKPCNDIIFGIMFANAKMFVRLCQSVHKDKIVLTEGPHSQAVYSETAKILNTIRFDVVGKAELGLITMDMQRQYRQVRQERRTVYYACRAISSQQVDKMAYEKLKPVHITFILTEYAKTPVGVRHVGLCYLDTHEPYDDLINLYLVSIPAVIKEGPKAANEAEAAAQEDLYVFAKFFAIQSQEAADVFCAEFENNELAKELVYMYNNAVADKVGIAKAEKNPYYTERLNEAQLEEARAEAYAEGKVEGKAEGASELLALLKQGYDADTAFSMLKAGIKID